MSPRTAIVTGAATGIGHAITSRLARDGLNVAVCDLDIKSIELDAFVQDLSAQYPNQQFKWYICDVSSAEQVGDTVQRVVQDFGKLDVVSNVP
jgi:NAD(P)-dependent dehydrogenase (short-subunit alcohol dehydrogenase family)